MQISIGQRVHHFEILERLGEGGMGEVFKAKDLKLGRSIALKVLKAGLMGGVARERFLREARVASSLNHPNIVTIFEAFSEDSVDVIGMEFISGRTLDRFINQNGLPLPKALDFALQIASALNAAHSAGIVHRDLKPVNIMVTDEGAIKVLDFGIAKVVLSTLGGDAASNDTATVVAFDGLQTSAGVIVGTVAYMSPEQAEGKPVDARSDIFSFGAILYEMLTGHRAFQADSTISTLAAVLNAEPAPLAIFTTGIPEVVQKVVSRCLRKDPERRFQTVADLRVALREAQDELQSPLQVGKESNPSGWNLHTKWVLATVAVPVLAGAFGIALSTFRYRGSQKPSQTENVFAKGVPLTAFRGSEANPSFAPSGNQVAFSWDGLDRSNFDIYVKLVGPGRPVRLTSDPRPDTAPSWSRDGKWIAFLRQVADNKFTLFVVPALGGRERALLDLRTAYILGVSKPVWSTDSKWIVVSAAIDGREQQSLARVGMESGQLKWITQPDAASGLHDVMPALSPSGRLLAFSRVGGGFVTAAFVTSVSDTLTPIGEPRMLDKAGVSALTPEWQDDDHLLVSTGGVQSALWRIRVSNDTPAEPLVVPGTDIVQPAIDPTAHRLAYVSKTQDANIWALGIASGTHVAAPPTRIVASTQADVNPQISPDGERVAFSSNRSGKYEIWVLAPDAPEAFQLTTLGAGTTGSPRWSPTGREIAFDSNLGGRSNVYVVSSDGGTPRKLTDSTGANVIPCWSKDGKTVFFGSNRSGTFQIWKMKSDGSEPVMITKNGGFAPTLSPGGDFLYYAKSPALSSDVWKVPVQGGEERKVIDSVYRYSFAVGQRGLYFVSAPQFLKGSFIGYFDFARGATTTIVPLAQPAELGLGLSPDEHRLLFAQADYLDSDIMLVETGR